MAEPEILIRPEQPRDFALIYEVNEAAFGRPAEARLVDALREDSAFVLSLVAERNGQIVGHALFTTVTLAQDGGGEQTGAALGPVAILPEDQRRGIGSALIRCGLERLREMGLPFCAVLGHPGYYPRFGFGPGARLGIRSQWDVPEDVFMVLELTPRGLENARGEVHYAPAFDSVS